MGYSLDSANSTTPNLTSATGKVSGKVAISNGTSDVATIKPATGQTAFANTLTKNGRWQTIGSNSQWDFQMMWSPTDNSVTGKAVNGSNIVNVECTTDHPGRTRHKSKAGKTAKARSRTQAKSRTSSSRKAKPAKTKAKRKAKARRRS